ncbi:hypothetical protein [Aliivibrio fischeri]|uniref:hypothetical protein n=1 Tax=Aliivibrio fischeri TaxID=668 RepID=UPI001112CB69|nr:hypothetical protein [Aliivibrio fischeri]
MGKSTKPYLYYFLPCLCVTYSILLLVVYFYFQRTFNPLINSSGVLLIGASIVMLNHSKATIKYKNIATILALIGTILSAFSGLIPQNKLSDTIELSHKCYLADGCSETTLENTKNIMK